jgi:ribosomal protein L35AE/L33A
VLTTVSETGASTFPTNAVRPYHQFGIVEVSSNNAMTTGKRTQNPNTSLIKIENVDDEKAARFYQGKRIAYVYRGKREIRGTKIRVIWGKVIRPHGTLRHHAAKLLDERIVNCDG